MNPLSALFGVGVAVRNALYDRGIWKARRLTRPVISVGNISVGGTGKTPFVIALGELLQQRGIAFDVLSRGYRRNSIEIAVVDPLGSPRQFGDEPLLIARKLNVPVVVGADRYRAGLLAEERFTTRLHLLDDGFQHRRLHRDFDIVLLPEKDLHDSLLPTGRLREPITSLGRADALVLIDVSTNAAGIPPSGLHTQIYRARRVITLDSGAQAPGPTERAGFARAGVEVPSSAMEGGKTGKTIAFCAIARPQQFLDGIKTVGQEIAGQLTFRDHHRYTQTDIDRLVRLRQQAGADSFITTEKDMINLGPLAAQLQPLRAARLKIELEAPEQALDTILKIIEQRCSCRL